MLVLLLFALSEDAEDGALLHHFSVMENIIVRVLQGSDINIGEIVLSLLLLLFFALFEAGDKIGRDAG